MARIAGQPRASFLADSLALVRVLDEFYQLEKLNEHAMKVSFAWNKQRRLLRLNLRILMLVQSRDDLAHINKYLRSQSVGIAALVC